MDQRTQSVLTRIGKEAALKYRGMLIKKENTSQGDKERVSEYLERNRRDNKTDHKTVSALQDLMAKGAFDHSTKSVNENVAREIEKETEFRVKRAIERGEIKPYDGKKF